jgi:Predicted solute binding protein
MQCPYCGQQHPDRAEFCPVTGHRLAMQQDRSRNFYLGLGGFSVLLVTISLLMLFQNGSFSKIAANLFAGNPTGQVNPSSNNPTQSPAAKRTATPFPTSTPRKTATPTATVRPTATATSLVNSDAYRNFDWSTCHAAYRTRLKPGDTVAIGDFYSPFGYHVLSGPYQDRDPVGEVSPGDRATIINGPSCSNRWIWWIIAVENSDVSGWFPEGDANSFWLLAVDDNLDAGTARISSEVPEVNLRLSPGYRSKDDSQDVIVAIPSGETVRLLQGPQVVEELNWWYVEWNSYKGWIAEKTGQGRLILILNP